MKRSAGRRYEIRLAEQPAQEWVAQWEGWTGHREGAGSILSGPVEDQAELFGLLRRIRDQGLTLVSLQQEVSMKTNAMVTGGLFLLGTITGVLAAILLGPLLANPDFLAKMAGQKTTVLAAAFLIVLMGLSCAGIGVAIATVLRPRNPGLAGAVAGFRVMEGTVQVVSAAVLVSLVFLAQETILSPASAPLLVSWGSALKQTLDWINNGAYLLPWCVAATMYYVLFYQTRLVPRWLSVWGLGGILLCAGVAVTALLGLLPPGSPLQGILSVPIAVQEMVLAVWLLIKGWNEESL